MEFSYSQTENFEMKKLSSDTGYFKKPVEINRGLVSYKTNNQLCALHGTYILHTYGYSHLAWHFYKLQWSETLLLACKCIFMNKDSSISTTHISKYLLTLDSKINVCPTFLDFGFFSRPYDLISFTSVMPEGENFWWGQ